MSHVASLNPEDFLEGGPLPSDFDGLIAKARFYPWDYDGKIDHYVLGVGLFFIPDHNPELDEQLDPFTQSYSAGDLNLFAPSMDGEESVDLESLEAVDGGESVDPETLEGIYALKVGDKKQLSGGSNWAHMVRCFLKVGFPTTALSADVRCFEGVRGHFDRIAQVKRSGLNEGSTRPKEILVITQFESIGNAIPVIGEGAPATPVVAPATTPTTPTPTTTTPSPTTTNPLDERLTVIVLEELAKAGGPIEKMSLAPIAIAKFDASEKAGALNRVLTADFLSSGVWTFNPDTDMISLG